MAESFPTTTEELDDYIDDRMQAGIAEAMEAITEQIISDGVRSYMQEYGVSMESNDPEGEVPLLDDNTLDADNASVIIAKMRNDVPISYAQARVRALAIAAAKLINSSDVATQIVEQTGSIVEIAPNVLNVWGSGNKLDAITVTFGTQAEGVVNEFNLRISVEVDEFTLTLPNSVVWTNGEAPEFEKGYIYEFSIVNNNALFARWEG